jgi:CheY-like chemotaxis protein
MANRTTVLVIEDNKDVREIVHEFLAAYGFTVSVAKDGQEGWDRFVADKPDLVLADVLLPKLNGFQVCQRIKTGPRSVPVILMSALYKTYALQQEARTKYGADDYLIKPLNLMDLARRICNLLGIERPVPLDQRPAAATTTPPETASSDAQRPPAPVEEKIGDSGELTELPPERLIGWLVRQGRTGRLQVTAQGVTRTVYAKAGMPIYVNSTTPAEQYTQMLLAAGKITPAQLADAEVKAKQTKSMPGKFLVENGAISQATLAAYLVEEVVSRLNAILELDDGRYEFVVDEAFLQKIRRPEIEAPNLVYRAICRRVSEPRLRSRFERRLERVVEKNEAQLPLSGRIDWEPQHLDVFILIDGKRTVGRIMDEAHTEPLTVWQLLYTLEVFDIVRFY